MKKILLAITLLSSITSSMAYDLIEQGSDLDVTPSVGESISTTFNIRVGAATKFKKGKGFSYKRRISAFFNHYYVGGTVCIRFEGADLETGKACKKDLAGDFTCVDAEAMSCVEEARELKVARKEVEIVYSSNSKYKFKDGETETFVVTVTQPNLDKGTSDDVQVTVSPTTDRGNNVEVVEDGDDSVNGKYTLKVTGN